MCASWWIDWCAGAPEEGISHDRFSCLGTAFIRYRSRHSLAPLKRSDALGIDGRLIWVDDGRRTKPFFNARYKVFGKPDLLYRVNGGVLAVEYKSRNGPIFESDIVQAKCAALSARGGQYKVSRILVKTGQAEKYITLPRSDHALYREIESATILARKAKNGEAVPCLPAPRKCRSCAYRNNCLESVTG